MAQIDIKYHRLLKTILDCGFEYEDPNRKGIRRIQIPHFTFHHNFTEGFPLLTTKKMYWKGIVGELLWFLRGETDIEKLWENNIHIWDKDSKEWGSTDLGRIYGAQWREWTSDYNENSDNFFVDQIRELITRLENTPMATRHIVTAWNPAELEDMALPPCHWSFEILPQPLYSSEEIKERLLANALPAYGFKLKWHQRSVDTFLGLPFNIASYALLARIIGYMTNMKPIGIIGDLSNVHIYEEHLEPVRVQMKRDKRMYDKSHLICGNKGAFEVFRNNDNLEMLLNNINVKDFKVSNYESFPPLKAEMFAYSKS